MKPAIIKFKDAKVGELIKSTDPDLSERILILESNPNLMIKKCRIFKTDDLVVGNDDIIDNIHFLWNRDVIVEYNINDNQ